MTGPMTGPITARRPTRARTVVAAFVSLGLLAAACGGDDDATPPTTEPATDDTADDVPDDTADDAPEPDADATEEPSTTDPPAPADPDDGPDDPPTDDVGDEAEEVGAWGIDVSDCPSDWDPTEGITDTEIRFGTSRPESGPLAVLSFLTRGIGAYFSYVNGALGGVDGRQLVFIERDDAYEPSRTVTNVIELVERERVFGLVGVVGTPNNLAVRDDLNRQCIPHLFNTTGAPEWGEVDDYPWTTGSILPYPAEAAVWADFIEERFPDGASVAVLAFDNDFGLSYERAFDIAIEGRPIEVVSREHHEATAPNLRDQVTTMAASDADVVLAMTSGTFCPMLIETVEQSAWDPTIMISATCAAPQSTFAPIEPAGDGVLVAASQRAVQADSDDPAIVEFSELMTEWAPDVPASIGIVAVGWQIGEMLHESLLAALDMDGGITRPNVLMGARSLDFESSLNLDGIRFRMDGALDPFPLEAARMQAWSVADQAYEPVSEVYDFEGRTGTLMP